MRNDNVIILTGMIPYTSNVLSVETNIKMRPMMRMMVLLHNLPMSRNDQAPHDLPNRNDVSALNSPNSAGIVDSSQVLSGHVKGNKY